MRNLAVVLAATVLLIPAAHAANIVDVTRPHIVFLSETATALACQSPHRRGCTTLQTEFFCACAKNGGQWTPFPRLAVTPDIYAATQDIVLHELEHIADVRASLNEYAASLTLRGFASNEACVAFIDTEKNMFSNTLRNIQRVTTVRRDGVQYAGRAGDH